MTLSIDQQLLAIFDITPEALQLNQMGELSPTQLHWLQRQRGLLPDYPYCMPVGLTISILLVGLSCCLSTTPKTIEIALGVFCTAAIILLISFSFPSGTQAFTLDARHPRLNAHIGIPFFKPPVGDGTKINRTTYYEILVNNSNLFLSQRQYEQLQAVLAHHPDQELIFFALPHSKRVLSAAVVRLDAEDFFLEV